MTTKLDVRVGRETAYTVVTLVGELDVISADGLRAALGKLLLEERVRLVVDATELTFCDSMGLRMLLEYADRATRAGGYMRLAGVRGVFRRILTVTGLHAAFPLYDTVAEAVAADAPN
ncbi:STAS domain-containing protein [Microbispora sp. ATCC PTA-5024]|uniref:STAS domain-containing protein n=1 Tax=Microbispora sp. ATCC PTA-5024 TaxID=316330 RepID=UPI0003DD5CB5|nr:STAS domain-containing protein [Microbispora sp. ATCC PTA-5024]ETK31156.1 hypothetical protein MPTA5024_36495 [Microbispora sp. ATCC PTA-5024]